MNIYIYLQIPELDSRKLNHLPIILRWAKRPFLCGLALRLLRISLSDKTGRVVPRSSTGVGGHEFNGSFGWI